MKLIKIAFIITLVSCSTSKRNVTLKNNNNKTLIHTQKTPDRMMFISYMISKNPDSTLKARVINKKIVNGKIKEANNKSRSKNNDDLVYLQLDNKSEPIDTFFVPNPLVRDVEYVNDSKALERKIIFLDSTEMFVRFQLSPKTKFIYTTHKNNPISKIQL